MSALDTHPNRTFSWRKWKSHTGTGHNERDKSIQRGYVVIADFGTRGVEPGYIYIVGGMLEIMGIGHIYVLPPFGVTYDAESGRLKSRYVSRVKDTREP